MQKKLYKNRSLRNKDNKITKNNRYKVMSNRKKISIYKVIIKQKKFNKKHFNNKMNIQFYKKNKSKKNNNKKNKFNNHFLKIQFHLKKFSKTLA